VTTRVPASRVSGDRRREWVAIWSISTSYIIVDTLAFFIVLGDDGGMTVPLFPLLEYFLDLHYCLVCGDGVVCDAPKSASCWHSCVFS